MSESTRQYDKFILKYPFKATYTITLELTWVQTYRLNHKILTNKLTTNVLSDSLLNIKINCRITSMVT